MSVQNTINRSTLKKAPARYFQRSVKLNRVEFKYIHDETEVIETLKTIIPQSVKSDTAIRGYLCSVLPEGCSLWKWKVVDTVSTTYAIDIDLFFANAMEVIEDCEPDAE